MKIQTHDFGVLHVQPNSRKGEVLVRQSEQAPYQPEHRGERYYQIIQQLPLELIPPRVGPLNRAGWEHSVTALKAETRALDKQICQYIDLEDDRYDRILKNCLRDGILDPQKIDRKVANDDYMKAWDDERRVCETALSRKENVLEGMHREMTATEMAEMPVTVENIRGA